MEFTISSLDGIYHFIFRWNLPFHTWPSGPRRAGAGPRWAWACFISGPRRAWACFMSGPRRAWACFMSLIFFGTSVSTGSGTRSGTDTCTGSGTDTCTGSGTDTDNHSWRGPDPTRPGPARDNTPRPGEGQHAPARRGPTRPGPARASPGPARANHFYSIISVAALSAKSLPSQRNRARTFEPSGSLT